MNVILRLLFIILGGIFWVLDTVFFYKLLTYFVSPKNNPILKLISIVSSFLLVAIMIFPEEMVNVVGAFALFFLIIFLCFSGSLIQCTAVVLILFPLIIAINFLTENLGLQTYLALGGVLRQNMGDVAFDSSPFFIMDSAIHLLYTAVKTGFWISLFLLLKRRLPNVKRLLTKPMWAVISVICLAPLSGIASLIFFTPKTNILAYPAIIFSIITIVGILLLTGYISDTVRTEMENKNFQLQQTYYGELEKNQRETAKLRHDMNNHLGVIAALIENGETEKARSYYAGLSHTLLANNRVFCKNSIVNAVINVKYTKAVAEGIDCFFNIDLSSMLSIDDISLCSIFANTLDNAIEACLLVADASKRSISLKARYADGYFSYEISNAKENPILESNGVIKTSKNDSKKHGYGLCNIRDIVEDYNGDMGIAYTETLFTLNILLKNL